MLNAIRLLVVVTPILLAAGSSALSAAESRTGVAGGVPVFEVLASVTGTVSVAGNQQRPTPLPVFKNRSFCGAAVTNETLLIGADGGLQNAVVLLLPVDGKVATQPRSVVLDNKHCAFTPHVQVATIGSDLLLKNSDPILHTVHARLGKETLFNVGLPKWRQVSKRLDRLGVIRIDCDVLHTWMSAAILVTDTRYFSLTDAAGRFTIERLPTGVYDMEVWHERLGRKALRVALSGGTLQSVAIVYSPK